MASYWIRERSLFMISEGGRGQFFKAYFEGGRAIF